MSCSTPADFPCIDALTSICSARSGCQSEGWLQIHLHLVCVQDSHCWATHATEIRPHSSQMHKRWFWYGEQTGTEQDGRSLKHLKCFDSSCFMLPEGTVADISRVFKETFDMEIPISHGKVVLFLHRWLLLLDDNIPCGSLYSWSH